MTTQYDNPNEIHSVSTLKIQTFSGNLSPHIYANGRNQLPIEITVKALSKDDNAMSFSQDTWTHILNLRFSESNEKLNWKGNSGWCFTDHKNDYSKEIQAGSHRSKRFMKGDDGTVIIIMYVYTDDVNTIRISVSVDTDNGKHFTTADISSGAEKMFLPIISLPEIDYGDRRNITIDVGNFLTISHDIHWDACLTNSNNICYKHDNGICERRFVYFKPNMLTTGQTKFKNHEINYEPINNNNVNRSSVSWDGSLQNGFNILKGPGYPCAVVGRGAINNNYQINIWFSRKNTININGQFFTHRKRDNYTFRFSPFVEEQHIDDNERGFATLILYKFTMSESNTVQHGWKDCIRSPTVKVTDSFGNEGTFQLTFNDSENFDIPGIV